MFIKIRELTKIYNNYLAVNKINFQIEKNKTIGLLGPNGCGKTTTIGMMLGLVTPTEGKILGLSVRSMTVDSIPILVFPPSIIMFTFLFNSSKTSNAFTGLKLDERFALGIASGNLINFNTERIILFLGNLIATVFKFEVAKGEILEFLFFLKMKVKGPGQNFL